jgi:chromosome segregation ATPase
MDPNSRAALLGKLELALDTVNSSLASVNGMLTENRPTIKAAMDNIKETSDTLNTGITKTIAKELDAASPQSLMAKIHASVEKMGQSLVDLNKITSAAGEVVALNKDNLNNILANFKETSDHMKAATKDLRRNPWRLLYRPTLEETKELNIFDAARAFAEAATRLDDATSKLKALSDARGGRLSPDDPQLKTIRADLQNTFDKFNEAEAALWKNLNVRQ